MEQLKKTQKKLSKELGEIVGENFKQEKELEK
jgi:hypothetical protein